MAEEKKPEVKQPPVEQEEMKGGLIPDGKGGRRWVDKNTYLQYLDTKAKEDAARAANKGKPPVNPPRQQIIT
jgi:hypothetical protein